MDLPSQLIEPVRRWLAAAAVTDPVDRGNAPAVQLFCLGLAAFLLQHAVAFAFGAVASGGVAGVVIDLTVGSLCLACVALIRRGRYRLGVQLLVAGFIAFPSAGMIATGITYHRDSLKLLALPLSFGALLLGRRTLWTMVACYLASFALAGLRDHGLLGPQLPPLPTPSPARLAAQSAIAFLLLAVILDRFGLAIRGALARALEHEQETVRAAAELAAANTTLRVEMERREKAEAQLVEAQKLEAVGRLAGGVAHDFNNIVGAILGFAEVAREGLAPGSRTLQDLDEIRSAGERAAALTRQLLAFSRKQMAAPRVLRVEDQLRALENLLRRLLGEDVELQLVLAPEPWLVHVDPGQLEQVVVNLVVNARDAMPRGGRLTVQTSTASFDEALEDGSGLGAGDYVVLVVTDTGSGMEPETRRRLFEPFFTTKEKGRGTGLGLATCYGIVRQAGGRITVYSEPGHGSTFRVYLPRDRSAAGAPAPAAQLGPPPAGAGETVLVVEDEPQLLQLALRVLGRAGYQVLTAASAEEALQRSRSHAGVIDLLVTDVVLPKQNGRELAEQLGRERPSLRLLFVSGHTEDAVIRHGVQQDSLRFLGKPFTGGALLRRVREVLDERHSEAPDARRP